MALPSSTLNVTLIIPFRSPSIVRGTFTIPAFSLNVTSDCVNETVVLALFIAGSSSEHPTIKIVNKANKYIFKYFIFQKLRIQQINIRDFVGL